MRDTNLEGIDWRNLQKGDVIPRRAVIEMWEVLFGQKRERHDNFVYSAVKDWLEAQRRSVNRPIIVTQRNWDMVVLTDEQAVSYLNSQANAGLRKHRKNTRRMHTDVDIENLSQFKRDELLSHQIRHGMIAAAIASVRAITPRANPDPNHLLPPEE